MLVLTAAVVEVAVVVQLQQGSPKLERRSSHWIFLHPVIKPLTHALFNKKIKSVANPKRVLKSKNVVGFKPPRRMAMPIIST